MSEYAISLTYHQAKQIHDDFEEVYGRPEPRLTGLKQARELRGMTQEELATAAGLSRGAISLLETGKGVYGVSLRTARAISAALGYSVDNLFPLEP